MYQKNTKKFFELTSIEEQIGNNLLKVFNDLINSSSHELEEQESLVFIKIEIIDDICVDDNEVENEIERLGETFSIK